MVLLRYITFLFKRSYYFIKRGDLGKVFNLNEYMRSYYAILEVQPTASANEIKQAFRRLSKLYHPDMNQGRTTYQNKLFEVIKAYEVLGDETERRAYDLTLFRTQTTAHTSQSSTARPTQASTDYYRPEIISFTCNQTYFFMGDLIEISWECKQADVIRLYPLGYMDELRGKIIYRVKELDAKHLSFELTATNRYSSTVTKRSIHLNNGVYMNFTEANSQEQVHYTSPQHWSMGFLAPLGRSSRKDYGLRVALLTLFFLMAFFYQPHFEHNGTYSFICTVLIYVLIICSARRLHDVNRHGILSLLLLIPLLNIAVMLILLMLKGDEMPNKHGRKPQF